MSMRHEINNNEVKKPEIFVPENPYDGPDKGEIDDILRNFINESFVTSTESLENLEPNKIYYKDGERFKTDDNGNIYAKYNKETGQYELLPNTTYELNGYKYTTDSNGNIVKAEGSLRSDKSPRKTINTGVNGQKEGDERGHIIADMFGGSNDVGNLVAMKFDLNRGDYKKMEEKLSRALDEGKDVKLTVEIEYDENGRPTKITCTYTIDGETETEVFDNT